MAAHDDSLPLAREPFAQAGGGSAAEAPAGQTGGGSAAEAIVGQTGGGAAEAIAREERRRRRRKVAALVAILVVLAIIIFLIIRALSGKSPLPSLSSTLPHYVSSIYGVHQPMGVAVSPSGERVYVTESEGPRLVRVYDSSGKQLGALRPPAARGGSWQLPVYVAVNPRTEEVYVSDRLREDIEVYDRNGRYLRALRLKGGHGGNAQPLGLAFGPQGELYLTDVSGARRDQRVLALAANGAQRTFGARGSFWFPNGIAVDSQGDVYVADSDDGRLVIFDPAGRPVSAIQRGVGEGDLDLPRGVAIDGDKRLYVVDTTAQTVAVYRLPKLATEVPSYVGSFGGEGIGDGQFQYPNGIAVDRGGRIYVTDRENGRVQVWQY